MNNQWQGAADWLRNNYQDYTNVASLCDAMLSAAPVSGPNVYADILAKLLSTKGVPRLTDEPLETWAYRTILDLSAAPVSGPTDA